MHPTYDIERVARQQVTQSNAGPRAPSHHARPGSRRAALAHTLRRVADRIDH